MKKGVIETAVGIFVLIGIVSLGYLTIKLGKMEWIGENHYPISAEFTSVSGLSTGAQVELAGVQIGAIESISLAPETKKAVVHMKIQKHVKLAKDSVASIKTSGLIGDKYINISPGDSKENIGTGGRIKNTESAVDLEAIIKYLKDRFGAKGTVGEDFYKLNARFVSVGGLRKGSSVEIAGVQIGAVDSIQLDPETMMATVSMKIREDVKLTDDVIASVKTSGLIGEQYINLSPGGSDDFLKPGDTILDTESAVDIVELMSKYVFGNVE